MIDSYYRQPTPSESFGSGENDTTEVLLQPIIQLHRKKNGPVSPRQALAEFRRRVPDHRQTEFLTGYQNMLNAKADQGTALPRLENFIRSDDWEGDTEPKPGPIKVPGAAKASAKRPTQQLCTSCNQPKSSFVSDGRCMDCFNS